MTDINKILKQWADGEKTVEETNEALKGTGIYVDPDKQKIAEGEGAVYCEDLSKINGMIMVDDGITPFKAEVKGGKLVCPIAENREQTVRELQKLGFWVTDSKANFIFAKSDKIGGKELYLSLKEKGVLIRHFETPLLKDYNRITVGSKEQMEGFIKTVREILEEKQ